MHRARSGHLACAPVPYSGVLWREVSRVILSDKICYAVCLREDRTGHKQASVTSGCRDGLEIEARRNPGRHERGE